MSNKFNHTNVIGKDFGNRPLPNISDIWVSSDPITISK